MLLDYKVLRAEVESHGLYERTYGYYFLYAVLVLCGMAVGFWIITLSQNVYIQLLNAVFLAFVFVQAGMLGHDLSHGQVFVSPRRNRFFAVVAWSLFGGISEGKWYEKHNAHHTHVNQIGHDPDIDLPFLFSPKQEESQGVFVSRFVRPYQHILFFLALPFIYPSMVAYSFRFIFDNFSSRTVAELGLIAVHFFILFYFVFSILGPLTGALFLLVHFMAGGLYMSVVFAPNHKGEEILAQNEQFTWLHQIILTRNIYPSQFIFHICGGLNFQIEHHLFTAMARPNYWKAQRIVKRFCAQNNIPYHETTWVGSMKEIYLSLKREARVGHLAPAYDPA